MFFNAVIQPLVTHFSVRMKMLVCMNTATALLLLPFLLQQHNRCSHRHVICGYVVTAHLLLEVASEWAFKEFDFTL
jgi:hypothetical protein